MNGSVTINGTNYPVTLADLTPSDVLPVFRTDTSILKTDSILLHAAGAEQNSAKKVLMPHLISLMSSAVAEDVALTIEPYYDENDEYQGMYWHYNGQWLRRTDTGEMISVNDDAAAIALAADQAVQATLDAQSATSKANQTEARVAGNEDSRVAAEVIRKTNEQNRQAAEALREQQAASDHSRAEQDHTTSVTQSAYAKNMADHPAYIADGTDGDANYWYIWDYASQQYVKDAYAKGDDLNYDDMAAGEKAALASMVAQELVFATTGTCEDIIDELT